MSIYHTSMGAQDRVQYCIHYTVEARMERIYAGMYSVGWPAQCAQVGGSERT